MTLALRILVVVVLQTFVLGQMIYDRARILENGITVVLKTQPIDPRDLFRGDYVQLNYEIGSLDTNVLEGDNKFAARDTVYVAVEQRGRFWSATGLYREPPKIIGNQVVMKGEVRSVTERRAPCPDQPCNWENLPVEGSTVDVDYKIDRYFVPEGEGRRIEAAMRANDNIDRVAIEVAVDKDGTAAIKALVLDGQVLYREKLF